MEESSSSRNTQEVLGAAQQLMQLSNEDDKSSSNVIEAGKKHGRTGDEEVDQKRCQIETSICSKMEEIFGKEEDRDFICRPKKRRYRSIESIYLTTKPMINSRYTGKGIST